MAVLDCPKTIKKARKKKIKIKIKIKIKFVKLAIF
jgi:hypothetical protein